MQVLKQFFSMGREKATQVMLAVHTQGKGVCGIYPQDIAETKASQVNQCARDSGHPLLCEVEPSSDDEEDGLNAEQRAREYAQRDVSHRASQTP